MGSSPSAQPATETLPYASREEATAEFAAHVSRGKANALAAMGVEIVIGEREGARFRDAYSGRWYWNCHCNGGVFNLGHRHPKVVGALRDALDHLDVGNHHLVSGWRARLGAQLADSTDGALPFAIFTPSGSEAVDLAVRLAASPDRARGDRGGARRLSRPGRVRVGGERPSLAGAVRLRPAGIHPCSLQRRRGHAGCDRRGCRRRDPRGDPGHPRLPAPGPRLPAGGRRRGAGAGRAADHRRGADGPRDEPAPPGTASRRTSSRTS